MSKEIAVDAKIELADSDGEWIDISDLVFKYVYVAEVGKPYTLRLFMRSSRQIEIVKPTNWGKVRLSRADIVKIKGVDVSDHSAAYSVKAKPGAIETVKVDLQYDPNLIRISGGPIIGGQTLTINFKGEQE